MAKFKLNEIVRIKGVPAGHPDEHARVMGLYDDDRVWVSNLNMPFSGSTSGIFPASDLEKIEKKA